MDGPYYIEWELEGFDCNGNLIHYYKSPNLQVNTGKIENLKWIGNLATTSPSGFIFLGYGPSSFTPAVGDTRLGGSIGYEYIGNGSRPAITNWTQSAETVTQGGFTFTEKLTGSLTINGSTDLNANSVGAPIQSYALFNTYVLPGTPTGTSGLMFNELVDSTQFLLKNGVDFSTQSVTIVIRQ